MGKNSRIISTENKKCRFLLQDQILFWWFPCSFKQELTFREIVSLFEMQC